MSANAITNISSQNIPTEVVGPRLNAAETPREFRFHDYSAIERWRTSAPDAIQPQRPIVRLIEGIKRRCRRERRRRAVGRAYDMALEISRYIPYGSEVLDVGCGNGLIAHHLSAILGTEVLGIDLSERTRAPIAYQPYDGGHFPVSDKSFDAVLLCYVLHHAQDLPVVLGELSRVLRDHGQAIVYEDMPQSLFDRGVCWSHNLQWRRRTGPCSFHVDAEWRDLFQSFGLEIVLARSLSRWRNLAHPVARRVYVLRPIAQLRSVVSNQ